ncbi:MAG: hypothetical protein DWQ09_08235 [Proteobacteria bacterium]|nr:MAG: hypothetical protein DWQ09_08235 [Pseudomonadota bacterium]QKK10842.1 MAG: hypothetical protein HND59_03770 [Pseudomonadota bacterium]
MQTIEIRYCFRLPDHSMREIALHLEPEHIQLTGHLPDQLPDWTRLDFEQCTHCPLTVDKVPHCPFAASLVGVIDISREVLSHDEVEVTVITAERAIRNRTTAQRGISAVMGLISATSGCPHTRFLKPMARYHLPFATEEETLYRAASMYLLAQYFRRLHGGNADLDLDGLAEFYRNLQAVNQSMMQRIRSASQKDAAANALVLLDLFAKAMPYSIEDSLEEVRYLFSAYLTE